MSALLRDRMRLHVEADQGLRVTGATDFPFERVPGGDVRALFEQGTFQTLGRVS